MKNNINLEELILRQLDCSLEMKSRFESKAIGYLAFITLTLTILTNFLIEVYKSNVCNVFRWTCMIFFIVTFCIGLVLLVLCTKMLLPKPISCFNGKKLLDFYVKRKTVNDADIDVPLLAENQKFIETNEKTIKMLDSYNGKIAAGLVYVITGFIVSSILFFIFIGVAK